MKKILILCELDPAHDPRPNRIIQWLMNDYELTIASQITCSMVGPKSVITIDNPIPNLLYFANRAILLKLNHFEKIVWSKEINRAKLTLKKNQFDLIICLDLTLLPLAVSLKEISCKVLFDAREYYPNYFEDQILWKFFHQRFHYYLCQKYLPLCDQILTVSDGIAEEYEKKFGIHPRVFMSLPKYENLEPKNSNSENIRILHHGSAVPSRNLELMIQMMNFTDKRFHLDLMLVPTNKRYFNKIVHLASNRTNTRIVPPVTFSNIIKYSNDYDIGLYLLKPNNFNLKHALPNKFFEMIQSRLAIAIGPSPEMSRIVYKYNCGIVSDDFNPVSLATKLNKLTAEQILSFKKNSHTASKILNAEQNWHDLKIIIKKLLGIL